MPVRDTARPDVQVSPITDDATVAARNDDSDPVIDRGRLPIRMIVSDDIVLESQDDTHVVVANIAQATRARLSRGAYRFLKAFDHPRRIDEVVSSHDVDRAMPHVQMLIDRHLLVNADAPAAARPIKVRSAVAYKFCNAPAYVAAQSPDFMILGVPCDGSSDTDGRLAPGLLRQKSLDYPYRLSLDDGRPRGWFDADRATWILQGATIADAGDVHVDHGEAWMRFRDRVRTALQQTCDCGAIPVILGGDLGVTRIAIEAMPPRRKLIVARIVADPTWSSDEDPDHDLRVIPHVAGVLRLDGTGHNAARSLESRIALNTADDAHDASIESDLPVYLSIDLALVTPAPGIDTRSMPALHVLKAIIVAIGAARPIVGIELVGLDVRNRAAVVGASSGCQLALTAMSAAYDRKLA